MKALLIALSALLLVAAGVGSGYLAAPHIDKLAGIETEPHAPGRAFGPESPLLSQPGAAGHLTGPKEGLDGDGLHPRL